MADSLVSLSLAGCRALVTGGTRGIGKAISEKLLEAGADVIITGTDPLTIKKLNAENPRTGRVEYAAVDFSNEASIERFVNYIRDLPRLDILINSAGINRIAFNTDTATSDFELLNDVNVKGTYIACREAAKLMQARGYGRIVNLTSIWSVITRPGRSLYTATKFAVAGLTKTLAVELAPYNVLVNSVGPGFTLTDLTASTNTPEELKKISDMIPMQRMALPEEIANLVLFLSSDLNTYLTGQNIIIDGGYTNV